MDQIDDLFYFNYAKYSFTQKECIDLDILLKTMLKMKEVKLNIFVDNNLFTFGLINGSFYIQHIPKILDNNSTIIGKIINKKYENFSLSEIYDLIDGSKIFYVVIKINEGEENYREILDKYKCNVRYLKVKNWYEIVKYLSKKGICAMKESDSMLSNIPYQFKFISKNINDEYKNKIENAGIYVYNYYEIDCLGTSLWKKYSNIVYSIFVDNYNN